MGPDDRCAFCDHKRKDHCKPGTWHSNYKDAARMVAKPRGGYCVGSHCTSPLCCCLKFFELSDD